MKEQPLVSVIIPVYNVERYLAQCLDSVINQTYPNLEIICVNDGSCDGSPDILRRYADEDARIQVIDKRTAAYPGAERGAGLRLRGIHHVRGLGRLGRAGRLRKRGERNARI